jgi:hypothetical protein
MKLEWPWTTSVIDVLPIDEQSKFWLKLWIWCDRLLWVGLTAALGVAIWAFQR